MMAEFNGKYKAIVKDTNDPKNMGRIKVQCPKVGANYVTAWCDPCFPCDGDFYIPPIGSCVWVEFCQGDLKKPVWLGGWYAENTAPNDKSTRIIQYAGATIALTSGNVLINGVDVLSRLSSLQQQIDALERRI